MRNDIFGWYDDISNHTYDPGLETICIFCAQLLSRPIKTISLMKVGDSKSYFYRCHNQCYEALSENEIIEIESSLIDSI